MSSQREPHVNKEEESIKESPATTSRNFDRHATTSSSNSIQSMTPSMMGPNPSLTEMIATERHDCGDVTTRRSPPEVDRSRGTNHDESLAQNDDSSSQIRKERVADRRKDVEETVRSRPKKKRKPEFLDNPTLRDDTRKEKNKNVTSNNTSDSVRLVDRLHEKRRLDSDPDSYSGNSMTRGSGSVENRRSSPLSGVSSSTSRSILSQSPPLFREQQNTISRETNPLNLLDTLTTSIPSNDFILRFLASRSTELPAGTSQRGERPPMVDQVPQGGAMPIFRQSPSPQPSVDPQTFQSLLHQAIGLQQRQQQTSDIALQEAPISILRQQQSSALDSRREEPPALTAMNSIGTDDERRRTMMRDILLQQLSMHPQPPIGQVGDATSETGSLRQQQDPSEALNLLLLGGLLQSSHPDLQLQPLQQSQLQVSSDHLAGLTRGSFLPPLPLHSSTASSAPLISDTLQHGINLDSAIQFPLTNSIIQLLATQDVLNSQRRPTTATANLLAPFLGQQESYLSSLSIPAPQLHEILAALQSRHGTSLQEQQGSHPPAADVLFRSSPNPSASIPMITGSMTLRDGIGFLASQAENQRATTTASIQGPKMDRPEKPFPRVMKLGDDGFPLDLPCDLALPDDEIWLSPHQVFLRQQIEVFRASKNDISTHKRGRNKPIVVDQVGIRCRHCAHLPVTQGQRGSTYFPATLHGIYQAAQNMNSTHLQCGLCLEMPESIRQQFSFLVSTRLKSSGAGRPHWELAAKRIGLVDSPSGIRFIRDVQQDATTTSAPSLQGGVNQEPAGENTNLVKSPERMPISHPSEVGSSFLEETTSTKANDSTEDTPRDPGG